MITRNEKREFKINDLLPFSFCMHFILFMDAVHAFSYSKLDGDEGFLCKSCILQRYCLRKAHIWHTTSVIYWLIFDWISYKLLINRKIHQMHQYIHGFFSQNYNCSFNHLIQWCTCLLLNCSWIHTMKSKIWKKMQCKVAYGMYIVKRFSCHSLCITQALEEENMRKSAR